jgi:hypothetical protein
MNRIVISNLNKKLKAVTEGYETYNVPMNGFFTFIIVDDEYLCMFKLKYGLHPYYGMPGIPTYAII